ncbi:AfsR/SARP family transcriptional regulator [Catenuloplanes atrovinosus]|uniref:DNA-binding SARP family transcriptional activator n=1 Tax=Catenuloplanes atrovinosus TaxID=137266 RepID=A0AAE3YNJ9_9ACTN|nr:BTAD domain-containing putative transcriptional regulator [Catenuloplanes atrovinosus]MDR7275792.1 DNA-binding SARP family transcriptional activator [Catenuloplanes atrovinosus]
METWRLTVTVLGPLTVTRAGRPVPVTAPRLRTVLAMLAMSAGTVVSVARLAEAVWGERLPGDARRAVQLYVTRLRELLGHDAIETAPDGYRLCARPHDVDALRFLRLTESPVTTRAALALWRGAPFDGVRSDWLHGVEAPRLVERYLDALERRIAQDLDAGRPGAVLSELRGLTARHPLHEPFWELLMHALYRCGRQADALAAYRSAHRRLDEEVGVPPGPALRDLHRRILTADPSIAPPADAGRRRSAVALRTGPSPAGAPG